MMGDPMPRDFFAPADPDPVMGQHMIDESQQPADPSAGL
jgi:hypothetical protein